MNIPKVIFSTQSHRPIETAELLANGATIERIPESNLYRIEYPAKDGVGPISWIGVADETEAS